MTARVRLISAALLALGIALGWVTGRALPSASSSALQDACSELAEEVSTKCHEADHWRNLVEKKYPNSTNNEEAVKSPEWERSMSWSQACDDAKEQLVEAILAALEPTPKSSPR